MTDKTKDNKKTGKSMKKTAILTILAATVMMAAISCTKELNGAVDKSGDTMSLTVSATLPD